MSSAQSTSEEWSDAELSELTRLVEAGLPLKSVAQRFGLTQSELLELCEMGRAPDAPMHLRVIEQTVRVGEVRCQERWMADIRMQKNYAGTLALLERRFKGVWGKEVAPSAPLVPEHSQEDHEEELRRQLQLEDSPLCAFLRENGWEPKSGR